MVVCPSVSVVDYKSRNVAVKAAIHKYVVSTVVYASVKIFCGKYIGEFVILAEKRYIDSRAAIEYMAIGCGNRGARGISRVIAGNSAADECGDKAGLDYRVLWLPVVVFCGSRITLEKNAVTRSN